MKNLLPFCLIAMLFTSQMNAQCNDLIISEVVFGSFGSNDLQEGNSNGSNYAVEIYNPSKSSISLSDYSIVLLGDEEDNPTTNIALSTEEITSIASEQTLVVAYSNSGSALLSKADFTTTNLDFSNKTTLILEKNEVPIDALGNEYLAESVPDATIIDILNDPSGVSDYGFKIEDVSGFQVRRSSLVEAGVLDQTVGMLLRNWELKLAVDTSDIGEHTCSCVMPIAFIRDFPDQMEPEVEVPEGVLVFDERQIEFTEANPNDVPTNMSLATVDEEFMGRGVQGRALRDDDYIEGFNTDDFLVMPAGETSLPLPASIIFESINDFISEGNEAVGYQLGISILTGVSVDPANDLFDILIFEDISSAKDLISDGAISVFPTILKRGEILNIENNDAASITLLNVSLISLNGVKSYTTDLNGSNQDSIVIPSDLPRGIYFAVITTSKGRGVTRIVAH